MARIRGLISSSGSIERREGSFSVVDVSECKIIIEVPGRDLSKAFILASRWDGVGRFNSCDEDVPVTVSINPSNHGQVVFGTDTKHGDGISFEINT